MQSEAPVVLSLSVCSQPVAFPFSNYLAFHPPPSPTFSMQASGYLINPLPCSPALYSSPVTLPHQLSWALQLYSDRSWCSLWVISVLRLPLLRPFLVHSERSGSSDIMCQGILHACRRLFTISLLDTLLKFPQSPVLRLAGFVPPLSVSERKCYLLYSFTTRELQS